MNIERSHLVICAKTDKPTSVLKFCIMYYLVTIPLSPPHPFDSSHNVPISLSHIFTSSIPGRKLKPVLGRNVKVLLPVDKSVEAIIPMETLNTGLQKPWRKFFGISDIWGGSIPELVWKFQALNSGACSDDLILFFVLLEACVCSWAKVESRQF